MKVKSKTKFTLTITLLGVLLFPLCSCNEDSDPYDPSLGTAVISSSLNLARGGTVHLGDSLQFTFSRTGNDKIIYIDVSLNRYEFDNQFPIETYLFETFYPDTKNALITVKWKIDSAFGITPAKHFERIDFHTKSKGGSSGSSGLSFTTIE